MLMRFNVAGTRLAIAANQSCRVWDVEKAVPLSPPIKCKYPFRPDDPGPFAIDPDGGRIACAKDYKKFQLWNATSGELIAEHPWASDDTMDDTLIFSSSGEFLITSNSTKYRVWNVHTGKAASPVNQPPVYGQLNDPFAIIEFSPDGKSGLWRMAFTPKTLEKDGNPAILFETLTGKSMGPPLRHGLGILRSEFSPDGSLLLTAGSDRTCRVWDAHTGKPVSPLLPLGTNAERCIFAPNGRRFATADLGNIRVWELGARATSKDVNPPHDEHAPSSFNSSAALLSVPGAASSSYGFPPPANSPEQNFFLARLPILRSRSSRTAIFSPDGTRGLTLIRKAGEESMGAARASLWALWPAVQEIQFVDSTGESSPAELLSSTSRT